MCESNAKASASIGDRIVSVAPNGTIFRLLLIPDSLPIKYLTDSTTQSP